MGDKEAPEAAQMIRTHNIYGSGFLGSCTRFPFLYTEASVSSHRQAPDEAPAGKGPNLSDLTPLLK
jgi:hypothetical protein